MNINHRTGERRESARKKRDELGILYTPASLAIMRVRVPGELIKIHSLVIMQLDRSNYDYSQ